MIGRKTLFAALGSASKLQSVVESASGSLLRHLGFLLNENAGLVDKSKQLALRVDLYFAYILISAIIISICELPLLVLRIEAARLIFLAGWGLLLFVTMRRMLKVTAVHGLNSCLQAYKILAACFLIAVTGSLAWVYAVNLGRAAPIPFWGMVRFVCLINLVASFSICAISILAIYIIDVARSLGRGA